MILRWLFNCVFVGIVMVEVFGGCVGVMLDWWMVIGVDVYVYVFLKMLLFVLGYCYMIVYDVLFD